MGWVKPAHLDERGLRRIGSEPDPADAPGNLLRADGAKPPRRSMLVPLTMIAAGMLGLLAAVTIQLANRYTSTTEATVNQMALANWRPTNSAVADARRGGTPATRLRVRGASTANSAEISPAARRLVAERAERHSRREAELRRFYFDPRRSTEQHDGVAIIELLPREDASRDAALASTGKAVLPLEYHRRVD